MFNMKVAALNVKINRCKTLEIKALVLIWFLLCVSLVLTRVELASVFFSFMGSFASALTLRMVTHSKNHILIRNSIGILVCVLATLLNSDARLPLGRPIHVLGGAKVESQQPEFQSLALITGYLVFDLWYTVHYHCGLKLLSLNNIWENALTLSIFVTILAKIRPVYVLVQFQTPALIWISYKICSLLWEMKRSIGNPTNVVPIPSTKTVDQSCERDTNRKACSASSETTLSESTNSFWMIHGVKFDLSDFVHRHPGGVEAIELGRGRDCTALFESYHPFTDKHWEILEKYKASEVDVKKLKADSTDPFYEAIKRRVITALEANGVNPGTERCASLGRSIYYIFICTCLAISAYYHTKGWVAGSFSFAIFGWLIGSLGHDAGHYAVSRKAWINDWCLWGMASLCNPVMWQHQHTYAHHSHTNDFDHDPDLHHFQRLLRVHRQFKYEAIHAYQKNPIYVVFSYMLVVFGTCLWIPLNFLKDGSLYGIVEFTNKNKVLVKISSLLHFVCYIATVLVAPFFNVGPVKAVSCGILQLATSGLLFAFFSQINHLNETSFRKYPDGVADSASTRKSTFSTSSSWAAKQVESSNNFATSRLLWHILSNGLNMQIEHHLFPSLNHCHLHLIRQSVRETCEEFSVEYKEYESLWCIVQDTLSWLDVLSRPS